jgi:hypothetical protein
MIREVTTEFIKSLQHLIQNMFGWNKMSNRLRYHLFLFLLKNLLPVLLAMYILFAMIGMILLPVSIAMIFLSPSSLYSIVFALIPFLSFKIAVMLSPLSTERLFIEQMRIYDYEMADELEYFVPVVSQKRRDSCGNYCIEFIMSNGRMVLLFLMFFMVSFVPVIGSIIGIIGQFYLMSEALGLQLLDIFIKRYYGLSYEKRRQFISNNRWIIIGFTLPYALLMTIPIVGPAMIGYAQAGTAELCHRRFRKHARIQSESTEI